MFKEKFLSICISAYFFVCEFRLVLFHFKNHNGVSLFNYPEKKWNLVPFPLQKGDVFSADNLATVNRHEFLKDEDLPTDLRQTLRSSSHSSVAGRALLYGTGLAVGGFSLGILCYCGIQPEVTQVSNCSD